MTRSPRLLRPLLILFALSSLGAFCLSIPDRVVAATKDDTEDLMREGIALRRAGRDADALPKFERAYRNGKTPRTAAQLGLCLQALGRWADADPLLAEALTSTEDPWIRKNRQTIKDALEQVKAHVVRVEILGQPEGARVAVNGRTVGSLPLPAPVLVNEGSVDIEVTANGYKPNVKNLNVVGGSFQSVVFRLESTTPAPTSAPAPLPLATAPDEARVGALHVSAEADATSERNRPITKSPWFWVGAAALVGGIVLGVVLATSGEAKDPMFDEQVSF